MGQRLSCCGGRPPRAAAHPPPVSPPEELAAWIFAAPLPALLRASAPHFVGAKRERGEATEAQAAELEKSSKAKVGTLRWHTFILGGLIDLTPAQHVVPPHTSARPSSQLS